MSIITVDRLYEVINLGVQSLVLDQTGNLHMVSSGTPSAEPSIIIPRTPLTPGLLFDPFESTDWPAVSQASGYADSHKEHDIARLIAIYKDSAPTEALKQAMDNKTSPEALKTSPDM